ncbi:MAG TPA: hypothetical protein VFP66_15045 [Candidatus Limnocylindrales bacterium]|nr:hypothetical protein [Candidatus Limnocylindrales bacterium]
MAALLCGPKRIPHHDLGVADRLGRGGQGYLAAPDGHPVEDPFEVLGSQVAQRNVSDRRQVGNDVLIAAQGVGADRLDARLTGLI